MHNLQANTISLKAPAKVNLRLRICGRRTDGYHLLSMLNVCVDLCDQLQLSVLADSAGQLEFAMRYDSENAPSDGTTDQILKDPARNIAAVAAKLFLAKFAPDFGLKLELVKSIPCGAGLGGGSSDAAAVLRGLAVLFQIERTALEKLALELGADVPFFLHSGFSHVSGIGEIVEDLPFQEWLGKSCYLILSQQHLATRDVFLNEAQSGRHYTQDSFDYSNFDLNNLEHLRNLVVNDLEPSAAELCAPLDKLLKALRLKPNLTVGMSGSGSALFVLAPGAQELSSLGLSEIREIATRYGARIRPAKFSAISALI